MRPGLGPARRRLGADRRGAGLRRLGAAPLYRTLPWLAAIRHELEQELFFQDRDLFSAELDLVFVDTTSVYLYRDGESDLVRHGYSRDRRPDLPQLVLCVAVDGRAGRWLSTSCPATPRMSRRSA